MKNKISLFSILFAFLLTLISCSKDDKDEENGKGTLKVSQSKIIFKARDSKKSFVIQTDAKWKILFEEKSWFNVSPMSGRGETEVFVEPQENTGNNMRSGVLAVKTENKETKISIQQKNGEATDGEFLTRAETTMENVFENMWNDGYKVMYDRYPNKGPGGHRNGGGLPYDRGFTFLWGFSSVLSAYNAMTQHTKYDGGYEEYSKKFGEKIFQGLDVYDNSNKSPKGYASFGNGHDDRYYDDNVWIGLDLTEMYKHIPEGGTLGKAKVVWNFLMSGRDDVLGDGIYWKEGNHDAKHTVSNAPVAVMGVKLYQINHDSKYLQTAKELYAWTKKNLQDPSDYLYWDNIRTDDHSYDKAKYQYNSGQMMQAAVLLYNATDENEYLQDARDIAESIYAKFFEDYTSPDGKSFRIVKDGNIWFSAVMFRGFVELYNADHNSKYIDAYEKTLDNAWKYARDPNTGLFIGSFKAGNSVSSQEKDILDQGGFMEMFARMYNVKNGIE